MPIWQLCANLLIPNCLRSNLSYFPLAALVLYVNGKNILISTANGAMQPTIVSTTNGSLVYDGTVSGQSVIPVTQGGIYIVKAGNTTKKVLVK